MAGLKVKFPSYKRGSENNCSRQTNALYIVQNCTMNRIYPSHTTDRADFDNWDSDMEAASERSTFSGSLGSYQ